MKRRHLFEFEDQPWLPATFRDLLTDVLRHQMDGIYSAALPRLAAPYPITYLVGWPGVG